MVFKSLWDWHGASNKMHHIMDWRGPGRYRWPRFQISWNLKVAPTSPVGVFFWRLLGMDCAVPKENLFCKVSLLQRIPPRNASERGRKGCKGKDRSYWNWSKGHQRWQHLFTWISPLIFIHTVLWIWLHQGIIWSISWRTNLLLPASRRLQICTSGNKACFI